MIQVLAASPGLFAPLMLIVALAFGAGLLLSGRR